MFRHHLLIMLRSMKKYRGSFLINIIGLSTGFACALFIYLWVTDEAGFDKFHKNDSQLYQVMELSNENGKVIVHEWGQGPLAEAMEKDLPEVEFAVPAMNLVKEQVIASVRAENKTIRSGGIFAGKKFFDLFSFDFVQGNGGHALYDKNSVVISEKLSLALFGSTDNVLGKTIEWELSGEKRQGFVTSIFKNVPANSSLQFDFVLSYDLLISELWTNGQSWGNEGALTFLKLKKGTDITAFNSKIRDFTRKYHAGNIFTPFVRPFSSGYLYGNYENGVQSGGRIGYVKLFSIIAIFILVIACINFMNLSTAKASRRSKEVGIKKAIGSSRRRLIFQFLSEGLFLSLLSLVLAIVLVALLLPVFNEITGKTLSIAFTWKLVGMMLGVTMLTGLLAGSYPAFYLSGFNPITVLKGKIRSSFGEILARKGLVVFQFVVSLVLIVSVLVITKQVNYVQSANPGYNKDNVIYFDKEGTVTQNTASFLAQLRKIPGVINASAIQESMMREGGGSSTYGISWPGKTDKDLIDFVIRAVDYDMIETLGIRVKEGRSFSDKYSSEDTKVILNETSVKAMGLKDPVGKTIKMWNKDVTIIGVVQDFHISSFHEAIAPIIFRYNLKDTYMIMAKIKAGEEKETLARIGDFYKQYNPNYLFDYKFLDKAYQAQYVSEQRVSVLSGYFAGLAILISCLGLFGLAAFNAEIRTKEIGVRKVLGASAANVTLLLSKEFFRLVIIAACIAFPLAWWAMQAWLDGFVYKINIGTGVFIIAFIATLLLTILTVGFQAIKAAIANPVKSLRTE